MMNRFTFILMNYKADPILDAKLNRLLDIGIKEALYHDGYYVKIVFNDNKTALLWDANKYYAWLSQGTIEDGDKTLYNWNSVRPKKKTMKRMLDALLLV